MGGDLNADFGFAAMFFSSEVSLAITHFRAYDPELGRWLSRDPLPDAEISQGPNLYAYLQNEPVSQTDRTGLANTGINSFTIGVGTFVATHAQEGEQLLRDLGERAEEAAPLIESGVESCGAALESGGEALAGGAETVIEFVAEPAADGEYEAAQAQFLEYEEWLVQHGQLGRSVMGPRALEFMEELQDLSNAFSGLRNSWITPQAFIDGSSLAERLMGVPGAWGFGLHWWIL